MTSPEDMVAFLKPRLTGTTRPEEVAAMMAPLASDSAWAYLGGSGLRQRIFRLAGDLRVVFEFDGADHLVAYGAYRTGAPWERDASGTQVSPVSGSEVTLVLVGGEGA